MPSISPIDFFDSNLFLQFLKIAVLIILFIYSIFALLIVRQTDLMAKTLLTPISPLVKAVGIVHAGFAIGIFVLAIGIL